jgi:hypothetical protein
MNGSAAGCSGRFPSGLAFLRGCSDDSFRSRLAAPPGAGMAVSLRNRVALKILRASGGGFRPWRTDFALQPRPVSSEALWPCSRSLVLFGTESVLLQDRGIRRSVIDVLSVLPHRVGPSVIVDSRLASRPHGRPRLLNRRGPPSMPRAELVTALPTRKGVNMLRNATFYGSGRSLASLVFGAR